MIHGVETPIPFPSPLWPIPIPVPSPAQPRSIPRQYFMEPGPGDRHGIGLG